MDDDAEAPEELSAAADQAEPTTDDVAGKHAGEVQEPGADDVESAEVDEPTGEHVGAAPVAEVTGHPAVDAVLASLEGLEGQPVGDHVAVFENAHDTLRSALNDAGEG